MRDMKEVRKYQKVWNKAHPDDPMPQKGFVIHHKDGDPDNNEPDNLEKMEKRKHDRLHHIGENNVAKRSDVRIKMAEKAKGNKSHLGFTHTEETKIKLSINKKLYWKRKKEKEKGGLL